MITAIEIPNADFARNSLYRKVRDRASYAFALVSVAAALEVENNAIVNVRIALGGDDYDSPLSNVKYEDIEARDSGIFSKTEPSKGETYASILQRIGQEFVEVEAAASMPIELMKYSMFSYGAQFAEVRVNEETGEVRVSRFLGSFDCGKIINPKTASSQFRGGIIMGIGMALTE